MKRIALCLSAAILAVMLAAVFGVCASAEAIPETKFYFASYPDPVTAACTGPGYYTTSNAFKFVDNTNNGISFYITADATRCLWAFPVAQFNATPYLHYEIPADNDICYKITFSQYWDVLPELELDIDEGTYCIDVRELVTNESMTLGWYYITVYGTADFDGTASINNFYLSNYGDEGDPIVDPSAFLTEAPETSAPETAVTEETTEAIAEVTTEVTTAEITTEAVTEDDTAKTESKLPIGIIIGIAAVVAAAAVAAIAIVKGKKPKNLKMKL